MSETNDTEAVELLFLVGSLRVKSVNGAVARAAQMVVPAGTTVVNFGLHNVPLYNGDVEEAGDPESVVALKEAARRADGIVFFTPEYNGSFPAVTKNAIDWLSRTGESAPLRETAITAIAATPGGRAGAGVLGHFNAIAPFWKTRYFGETLGIGKFGDKLDDRGEFVDAMSIEALRQFLNRFAKFAAES